MSRSIHRKVRLVRSAIKKLKLDLEGETVYTEAATGNFAVTAPIAAAAGAENVFALAKDSPYGTAAEAKSQIEALARRLSVSESITFVTEKQPEQVRQASIITNTGFVRPIDAQFVDWMNPNAVVALMYEPWEFRDADIDIRACWNAGIPVLGTDESNAQIATQSYLPHLVSKLSFEHDIEVFSCNYVIVGNGSFAEHAVSGLSNMGADVTLIAPEPRSEFIANRRDCSSFESTTSIEALSQADVLVVLDHGTDAEIIGPDGYISAARLTECNESLVLVHICGNVDKAALEDAETEVVPQEPAPAGHMSYTLGYLGPKPVVDLHAGGLKVGELGTNAQRKKRGLSTIIELVTSSSVAADFPTAFKEAYDFESYVD
ncbi:MAG: NAD(P)-dependent oxidoreductase [Halorientalis sp.]